MIDCACVIHGDAYDFEYVHKLYRGLQRGFGKRAITLHVYTEEDRPVPAPYVKHVLQDMRKHNCRKGWWYKTQLFDRKQFNGQLIYFDLDVAITGDLSWILELDTKYFWGIRDFRYLFNPRRRELNSSVMYFNTDKFNYVWSEFKLSPETYMNRLHGDQNFIDRQIPTEQKRFFEETRVKSWRWELVDGGYDIETRKHKIPGLGTIIDPTTSVAVFHGKPKLHDIIDAEIDKYWY